MTILLKICFGTVLPAVLCSMAKQKSQHNLQHSCTHSLEVDKDTSCKSSHSDSAAQRPAQQSAIPMCVCVCDPCSSQIALEIMLLIGHRLMFPDLPRLHFLITCSPFSHIKNWYLLGVVEFSFICTDLLLQFLQLQGHAVPPSTGPVAICICNLLKSIHVQSFKVCKFSVPSSPLVFIPRPNGTSPPSSLPLTLLISQHLQVFSLLSLHIHFPLSQSGSFPPSSTTRT